MASLGTLSAILSLNSAPLEAGAGRAEKRLGRLRDTMSSVVSKAALMGGSIATGAAAGLALLTKRGLEAVDSQGKLARNLGGTIDGLRGLQIATGDAGVSSEALATSMRALNARLGEAETGSGEASDALKNLGLNAKELQGLDVDQRMAAISDRVKQLGLNSSQTADVLRSFGIRSLEMVDFMRQGGDAIRAARSEVDDYGLSLSEVDAAQVEAANDAFSRIGRVTEGVSNQLAVTMAPIMSEIAERFNKAAKESGGWKDEIKSAIELGIKGFGKLLDVLHGVRVSFKLMQVASAELETGLKSFAGFVGIGDGADDAKQRAAKLREELHQLAIQEMPSDKAAKFLEDVRKRSEEAAEAAVKNRGGGDGADIENPEAERHKAELAERLARIMEANMTEQAVLAEKFELEQELIRAALENKLLTQAEFDLLMQDQTLRHQEELTAIEDEEAKKREDRAKAEQDAKKSALQKALSDASTLMNTGSRKLFEIGKAAALANAFINAKESIVSAFAAGSEIAGPPLGAAYAAAAAAAQFAQISAIKSASFGNGGTGGSGGGGGASVTQSINAQSEPVRQRQSQAININVAGGLNPEDLYSGKMIRALFDELNANIDNGMSFNVQ